MLSPDERSVDLLYRTYRYLRLKNVGDERPFSSLRRSVEHEALVALQARDVGVATPRMRAIAAGRRRLDAHRLRDDRRAVASTTMDGHDGHRIGSSRELWGQVACLREHRIAHRDLRRANVLVDGDDEPWLTGFAFSEVAASDDQLDGDIAQLLAALSLTVGRRPRRVECRRDTRSAARWGPRCRGCSPTR